MTDQPTPVNRALSRFSAFCVAWALLLLFAGANVTTTRSGDAIPSWPEPLLPRDFSRPALIEWSHRGVAAWMGIFTLVLAVSTQRRDERPAVRKLAWGALALVLVQAAIGGLRVRLVSDGIDATPTWAKVLHGFVGQSYLCVLAVLATVLAPWWRGARRRELDVTSMSLLRGSMLGCALLVAQVLLGALARHGAVPREVHAFVALPVMIVAARLTLVGAFDVPADEPELRRPARLLGALAAVQLALGLVTYFVAASGTAPEARDAGQVIVVNLHLAAGAAMLATVVSLLLRTLRLHGLPTDERVAAAESAERSAPGAAS